MNLYVSYASSSFSFLFLSFLSLVIISCVLPGSLSVYIGHPALSTHTHTHTHRLFLASGMLPFFPHVFPLFPLHPNSRLSPAHALYIYPIVQHFRTHINTLSFLPRRAAGRPSSFLFHYHLVVRQLLPLDRSTFLPPLSTPTTPRTSSPFKLTPSAGNG